VADFTTWPAVPFLDTLMWYGILHSYKEATPRELLGQAQDTRTLSDFRTDYLGTPTPLKLYYLRPVFIGCPKLLAVLRLADVYGRAGSVGRIGYELELAPSPDAFNAPHLFLSLVTSLAFISRSLSRMGRLPRKRRDSCFSACFARFFFFEHSSK